MRRFKHALLVLTVLLSAACSRDLDISIRFPAAEGLQPADRVLVDAQAVGQVQAVTYTAQGDFLVAVRIAKDRAALATRESIYFIDADRDRKGHQAVVIMPPASGGTPLADGDSVNGVSAWAARLKRMQDQIAAVAGALAERYGALWDEAQKLSQSEEIRRLEQALDRILADVDQLGQSARETLRNDIMPWIAGQIETLRRELEALGRGDQLDPLDEKVRRIEAELQV